MTDDSLLDTPVPPSTQALSAPLTLAALEGAPDRVQAGVLEAIADPNTAIAVIGLLTKHLAITLVGRHGKERAKAMRKGIHEVGLTAPSATTAARLVLTDLL